MLKKTWLLAGCAVGAVVAAPVSVLASGAEADFQRAYDSITGDELGAAVERLASDEFEGRNTGTPGEEKTVRFIEKAFKEAGASPGVGRSYFQRVPLLEIRRDGDPTLRFSSGQAAKELSFDDDFVTFSGGASADVEIDDADLVFVGFGIDAPEENWNDYAGVDVRGKIVVALRGEPDVEGDDSVFGGAVLTRHGSQPTKYDAAKIRGAKGVILIHTEQSAGYPWSVLQGGGVSSIQHFIDKADDAPKLEVVIHLREGAAADLFAMAGLDLAQEMQAARKQGYKAKMLNVKAAARYDGKARKIKSRNVIAKFEGAEAPDECVLFTGHWDHVGKNEELEGDQIFNGAVDNATGTAGLIELAGAFGKLKQPLRRTVYIIATTAEEKGLLGAEYYAENPICPLENTAAVINLDALFPFGPFNAMTVTALGSSEVEDVLAQSAARLGRILEPDSNPGIGAYYRSDHYPFAKRGVPAIFSVGSPRLDELTEDSPILQRYADYGQNGYHKVGDEYDPETWDMRGIEGDVRIFFETGYRIANDVRFPNWRYDNQFRRLRDAMR